MSGATMARQAGLSDATAIIGVFDAVARESPWLIAIPGQRRPDDLLPALGCPQGPAAYWVAPATGVPQGVLEIQHNTLPALAHTATFGMAVLPTGRRQGLGRALIAQAEVWALRRGVQKITILCADGNTAALALYAQCGYAVEARQHRQFRIRGTWVDALWLAHWLQEETYED